MGTMTRPPAPVSRPPGRGRERERERSVWDHPFLIVVAVALVGWGAYRAGRKDGAPAETAKPPAEARKSPLVQAEPASVPASYFEKEQAEAPPPRVRPVDRPADGAASAAKPDIPAETVALMKAQAAQEQGWKERAAAARARLAKAQDDYDKVSAANPVVYLQGGGVSASALGSRNAILTPYQLEVDAARTELEGLSEACRKAGCLPGWIR